MSDRCQIMDHTDRRRIPLRHGRSLRSAMNQTRRRTIVAGGLLAASGALAVAVVAKAQGRPRRIAWISEAPHPFVAPFRGGLAEAGLVEQQDFVISTHYA